MVCALVYQRRPSDKEQLHPERRSIVLTCPPGFLGRDRQEFELGLADWNKKLLSWTSRYLASRTFSKQM